MHYRNYHAKQTPEFHWVTSWGYVSVLGVCPWSCYGWEYNPVCLLWVGTQPLGVGRQLLVVRTHLDSYHWTENHRSQCKCNKSKQSDCTVSSYQSLVIAIHPILTSQKHLNFTGKHCIVASHIKSSQFLEPKVWNGKSVTVIWDPQNSSQTCMLRLQM